MSNKIRKCVGKESFLRMNYLYQLSNMSLKNGQELPANFYTSLMIGISKKSVQRIEPNIKRTICKRCHQLLLPGITCDVKIKKKVVQYVCKMCKAQKCFKATKDYMLWTDKPEALVEVLDYTKQNLKE